MSECVTGKICFISQAMAEEQLILNRAKYDYGSGAGPVNIYHCPICQCYHFTSKGDPHPLLSKPEIKDEIKRTSEAIKWEEKLKNKY